MKFKDSRFNSLKVTVDTKKCDTHTLTHALSKSNMPHQLYQSWGHKILEGGSGQWGSCLGRVDVFEELQLL